MPSLCAIASMVASRHPRLTCCVRVAHQSSHLPFVSRRPRHQQPTGSLPCTAQPRTEVQFECFRPRDRWQTESATQQARCHLHSLQRHDDLFIVDLDSPNRGSDELPNPDRCQCHPPFGAALTSSDSRRLLMTPSPYSSCPSALTDPISA